MTDDCLSENLSKYMAETFFKNHQKAFSLWSLLTSITLSNINEKTALPIILAIYQETLKPAKIFQWILQYQFSPLSSLEQRPWHNFHSHKPTNPTREHYEFFFWEMLEQLFQHYPMLSSRDIHECTKQFWDFCWKLRGLKLHRWKWLEKLEIRWDLTRRKRRHWHHHKQY